MAGVSRQAVSAVESGQSDPSLRVALALALALGLTVDELFGAEAAVPTVTARPVRTGAARPRGERVTLAPIGDSFVALPLSGPTVSKAGFLPAGGLVAEQGGRGEQDRRDEQDEQGGLVGSGGQLVVQPIGPPRTTLVIAGCDPALPLLEEPLSLLDPPIAFSWWPCGSREALRLAAEGLVHVAGVHLMGESGGYSTGPAAELLAQGGEVIGFSAWREGVVLRPDLLLQVENFADVARAGLRVVNRELGSEARSVLDRELTGLGLVGDDVPGYDAVVTGHLQVADAVAAGLAEFGVASEPAALAYGLAFIPLAAEQFDLVIPAERVASREVQALIKVLSSRWLLDQLASLPGYDTTPCGQAVFSQARAQAY
jgi:molybdate-binding protein/DNA-binding XRE family transcriptional regulator